MSNADQVSSNDVRAPARWPLAHEGLTLRILIVIDGRIILNHDQFDFGLGFVIDSLRATWSREFRIHLGLVTREHVIGEYERGVFDVLHTDFRFDQPGFQIDDWDQIWIFADQPSGGESDHPDADSLISSGNPLGDEEVRRLAEWMDRGGGLFATGDHNNLGASVCHRIPRVRTMRKWRMDDGVPSRNGERQNRTLQGTGAGAEYDLTLQPLELVFNQSVASWPFYLVDRPHPILCSTAGPINRFPDHMHEGELVADANVQLDRPLEILEYARPEYPRAVAEVPQRRFGPPLTLNWRPRPSIIAYGRRTNRMYFEPPSEREASMSFRPDSGFNRFGIVSVYDGEAANIGRIVCDSTWHHWLSENLHAIATQDPPAYRMMQSYYRNIAMWLAKIPQRRRLLTATVWNVLTHSSPMEFTALQSHWEMGHRVIERMKPFISPCWVNELVASQFDATSMSRIAPPGSERKRPEWSGLPEDLVNNAVIGSLAKALHPLASTLRLRRTREQDVLADVESIEKLAESGIAQVPGRLKEAMTDAIATLTGTLELLDAGAGKSTSLAQ